MSASFEDRLWQQLATAAERQQRRGPLRRALVHWRDVRWLLPVAAVAALILVVLAVLARSPAPPPASPRIVSIGGSPTGAVAAAGEVWIYDGRALVRVDAGGRVVARHGYRNPVATLSLASTGSSVWALPTPWDGHSAPPRLGAPLTLTRLDGASGRVTARIAVRAPGRRPLVPFGVVATGSDLWVWGRQGALLVDTARNRVARAITIRGDAVHGFAATASTAWLATQDGRLVRYDVRTGRKTELAAVPPRGALDGLVAIDGRLALDGASGTLLGLDAATGTRRWSTRVPGRTSPIVAVGDTLLVSVPDPAGSGDELLSVDALDGRITARHALPGTARAIVPVGRAVWVVLDGGTIAVLR
jgi:outer membrane protein assembly factor BamB